MTAETVCERARAGDASARAILDRAAEFMGIGLANLLQTLNLERIVLGTLAVKAADLLMEPILASTRAHCWPRVWEGVEIVPAALGAEVQDKAALALALISLNLNARGRNTGAGK